MVEIDSIGFGKQVPDYSISRIPNGYGNWQLTQATPGSNNTGVVTLGSASALRFNEWAPTNGTGDHDFEDWLELYNTGTNPVALAGLVITNTLMPEGFPVPSGAAAISNLSFIEANGFAQFYAVGRKTSKPYDANELNFKLSFNSGETLVLYEGRGKTSVFDRVTFYGQSATNIWYQITGITTNIICTNPPFPCITLIETNAVFYTQGRLPDGAENIMFFNKETPEDSNFQPLTNLWPELVINEVLAHTDPPLQDAVELYNGSPTQTVDISYYWLSNSKNNPSKYRFPPNTRIPPLSYKVVYEYQFNSNWTGISPQFTFNSSEGDECYIFSATNDAAGTLTGYRRGMQFGGSENGVSFGRYVSSEGDGDMVPMTRLSLGSIVDNTFSATPVYSNLFVLGPGAPNAAPIIGPVVITEFMYHPPNFGTNDNTLDEYIELYNLSTKTVPLYDTNSYANAATNRWNINEAVDYAFPTNNVIRPGEFIVLVGFDPANTALLNRFRTVYNIPSGFTNIFGPWQGKLSNGGTTRESIEWRKPDRRQTSGQVGYVPQILVDEIRYDDDPPWPTNRVSSLGPPDGGGAALARVKPDCYGDEPTNWVAAAPSPGRAAPPEIESIQLWNDRTVLSVTNVWAGCGFTVQYATNMAQPFMSTAWRKLVDVPPQVTTGTRLVTNNITPRAHRFYRLVTPIQ